MIFNRLFDEQQIKEAQKKRIQKNSSTQSPVRLTHPAQIQDSLLEWQ